MIKKTVLLWIALASVLILGIIIFDILHAPKRKPLQSVVSEPLAPAIAIDMDLEENDIPEEVYVLNGKDPLLVMVMPSSSSQASPIIHIIKNLAELKSLDILGDHSIHKMDPTYKTLALAYLPEPNKNSRFLSTEKKPEKIRIVLLSTAGINSILLNNNWIQKEQISHPNFKVAAAYALMADNSKRPVVPVQMPVNILADIQNPEKVLLVQQELSR